MKCKSLLACTVALACVGHCDDQSSHDDSTDNTKDETAQ